jgi:hypothetical protein
MTVSTVRGPLVALLLLANAQTGSAAQGSVSGPGLPAPPSLPAWPGTASFPPIENGNRCEADTNCRSVNCRPFPGGASYCAAVGRVCPVPNKDGAKAGQKTKVEGRCYECRLGRGWTPC